MCIVQPRALNCRTASGLRFGLAGDGKPDIAIAFIEPLERTCRPAVRLTTLRWVRWAFWPQSVTKMMPWRPWELKSRQSLKLLGPSVFIKSVGRVPSLSRAGVACPKIPTIGACEPAGANICIVQPGASKPRTASLVRVTSAFALRTRIELGRETLELIGDAGVMVTVGTARVIAKK